MPRAVTLDSLPRGRHSLSRAEVARAQRRRLLRAMIDEVADTGYAATTASAVYRRAAVSSRAFYEQFANKEECFLAAYDSAVEWFMAGVRASRSADDSRSSSTQEQLSRLLRRYLQVMSENPNFARAFLIEIYSVDRAVQRRDDVQRAFVSVVEEALRPTLHKRAFRAEDRFAIEAFVAAVTYMVTARIASRAHSELPSLHDPLMKLSERFLSEGD